MEKYQRHRRFIALCKINKCVLGLGQTCDLTDMSNKGETLCSTFCPCRVRWKRNSAGVLTDRGKKVLEFVAIQRKDNDQWAIPGVSADFSDNLQSRRPTIGSPRQSKLETQCELGRFSKPIQNDILLACSKWLPITQCCYVIHF